jgi:hypothetical protein
VSVYVFSVGRSGCGSRHWSKAGCTGSAALVAETVPDRTVVEIESLCDLCCLFLCVGSDWWTWACSFILSERLRGGSAVISSVSLKRIIRYPIVVSVVRVLILPSVFTFNYSLVVKSTGYRIFFGRNFGVCNRSIPECCTAAYCAIGRSVASEVLTLGWLVYSLGRVGQGLLVRVLKGGLAVLLKFRFTQPFLRTCLLFWLVSVLL